MTPPPITARITVARPPAGCFELFTTRLDAWWPHPGPDGTTAPTLEPGPGGVLRSGDGRVLAEATVWEPPTRLVLTWSMAGGASTEVEVTFVDDGAGGCTVALEHRGWDALGDAVTAAWAGFEATWPKVISRFGGEAMADLHRAFARSTNQLTWSLLGRDDRSTDDDEAMLGAAHASLYHWSVIAGPVEATRGEWLVSHVYAVLGRSEPAMHHAERALAICTSGAEGIADFDLAYGHEAVARAAAGAGDLGRAAAHHRIAADLGATIADDEDRSIFTGDLESEPWFGLVRD